MSEWRMELSHSGNARVRFTVLESGSSAAITAAVNDLVEKNATLLIKNRQWLSNRLSDCL